VEIGEIESQIVSLLPDAREAVVDVVHPAGDAYDSVLILVALIEYAQIEDSTGSNEEMKLHDPSQIPETALKALEQLDADLGQVLPPYMVPSVFLLVSKLPINASGKLDRRIVRDRLNSMSRDTLSSLSGLSGDKQAPSTVMEKRLHSLYTTVLELSPEAVGVNDSFFRLGGDSMAAMKVTAKARSQNIPLSVADIFHWPQLADLAMAVKERAGHENGSESKDPAPLSLWPELAEAPPRTINATQTRLLEDIATQCGISATQIEDVYPCSPLQAGLMAITAQHPEAYSMQRAFKLHATLPIEQLKDAWTRLVNHLPILRTRIIPSVLASALQVVVREPPTWHHSVSLEEYLALDRATPITYGGVLSRTAIVDNGASSRYFVWTMHHSIYDGWSVGKMMQMLAQILKGDGLSAPIPVSRYIAYISQQHEGETAQFWQSHFGNANWTRYPPLPLEQYQINSRDILQCQLHIPLSRTSSMIPIVLRASWALLVAVNTGSDEAIINVVLSGRMAPVDGIIDLVAPTIATVPFCVSALRNQPVRDFLADIQRRATEMIPYEHTGLQNIRHMVPSLGADFDPGHIFVVQPSSDNELEVPMDVESGATSMDGFHNYALTVECTVSQEASDVGVEIRYDREVLAVENAQHLLSQFGHIVQQLAHHADSEQQLGQLQLLSVEDSEQLCKWNHNTPPQLDRCLHDEILNKMLSQPDALAISAWDGEMTYGELDYASRWLAHHLVRLGVGPEIKVGLCMDKSKWAVVAIMAILRAGGAVLPLGVQHPLARIEGILNETAAPLILVDGAQEQRLETFASRTALLVVDDFLNVSQTKWYKMPDLSAKPCTSVRPENIAWIIYTSGSTGTPKSIVLEHGALVVSVLGHGVAFNLKPDDRVLQFAAYTFDVSIQDNMAALSFGAVLCVPSEDHRMNRLVSFVSDFKVTTAILTPKVATLIQPHDAPTLRTMILGGEALSAKVVDQWIEHADVINSYGPSETCIHALSKKLRDSSERLNLGVATAARTWIVNPANVGQLVPIGAPGELLIEGPPLSRGYLNDPERTAASFMIDPAFVSELGLSPGRRMYRTGDLVQQNMDGTINYIGRRDNQVKIRGQRVEMGEIESQILLLLPERFYAAYVAMKGSSLISVIQFTSSDYDVSDGPVHTIVAPSPEQQKSFESLTASLREKLPSYMVPSAFLTINTFPLNENGKLDRRRVARLLDAIPSDRWLEYTAKSQTYQQPVGVTEELLCELWALCIGLDSRPVSRLDNFFDLGGDSITAMALVQHLWRRGLRLSATDVFSHPVLSHMAASVTTDMEESAEYERFSLVSPEDRTSVLEYLFSDASIEQAPHVIDILPTTEFQAQVIRENMAPKRRQLNQFAFDASGPCDINRVTSAISDLVMRIESLRTAFARPTTKKFLQVVYSRWQPKFRVFHTEKSLDDFCRDSLEQDLFSEPTLSRPMFDVAIVNANTTQHRIIFRISHALYDGATSDQIWTTLEAITAGQQIGSFIPVGSFFQSLHTRTTHEAEDYWRELLQGATIPCVSTCTNPLVSRMGTISSAPISLPSSGRSDVSIAMAVKAAWGIVLGQHTASHDVAFADIHTGRNVVHPSVAGAVACCARALPCRIVYEPDWTMDLLLEQIKQQQLNSMRYEGLELQQLAQRYLAWPEQDEAEAPDLRVTMVNHLKALKQDMSLGATVYQRVPLYSEHTYASVDFSIETVEEGDGSLSAGIAFAADRIPDELARELFDGFRNILAAILANPLCSVSDLLKIRH
jgi:amino acid adenylation domain-containing protein